MDGTVDSGENSATSTENTDRADIAAPESAAPTAEATVADAAQPAPYGTPGAATTAQPAGPSVTSRAVAVVRSVAAERYIAALIGAAAIYAATWLLALVFTLLAFVAAADASLDWGLAFAAPAQIVGLAVAGTLTSSATVLGISASVSFLWLPLLVTAFLILASMLVARRDERIAPSASRGIRWLLSGLTGLVLAVLVTVIAAVTPLSYVMGDGTDTGFGVLSGTGTASSASFTAFLGALVVGTLASYLARASVARRAAGIAPAPVARAATSVRASVRSTLPVVGLYLGVLATLLAVVLLITGVVNSGINMLLTAFFWLPTLVVDGLGLVNLAPVTFNGSLAALAGMSGSPTSFWLPTMVSPGWIVVLVLFVNVILILATGVVLNLRRAQLRLSAAVSWLTTILVFALVGIAISVLGSIAAWTSVDTSGAGESLTGLLGGVGSMIEGAGAISGTLGLAAWTFIVFAALGAIVEAVAVFVAPSLVQLLPTSVLAGAARVTAVVGVPFALPGTGTVPAAPTTPVADGAPTAVEGGTAVEDGALADGPVLAPVAPVAPVVPVAPMSLEKKRRVRIVLAAVGGTLVLVLGASIAISIVNQVVYSPEHQVESYLDAVIAGDATAALEIGDVKGAKAERVLLTNEVLKATDGGITGYTITDVTTSGEGAVVTADIDQADEQSEMTYTLVKKGKTALLFDNWSLDSVRLSTLPIQISPDITELDINGVAMTLTDEEIESGYLQLLAFPGAYVVGSGGDDTWLAAKPQTVQVGAQESYETAKVSLEPTEQFTASIDEQVADFVAGCAAQKLLSAEDCPLRAYDYGTITDVVWTIDEPAVTTLNSSYNSEWSVFTDERGSATVTYTKADYFGVVAPETETVSFSINGTVKIVDGAPVFKTGY